MSLSSPNSRVHKKYTTKLGNLLENRLSTQHGRAKGLHRWTHGFFAPNKKRGLSSVRPAFPLRGVRQTEQNDFNPQERLLKARTSSKYKRRPVSTGLAGEKQMSNAYKRSNADQHEVILRVILPEVYGIGYVQVKCMASYTVGMAKHVLRDALRTHRPEHWAALPIVSVLEFKLVLPNEKKR